MPWTKVTDALPPEGSAVLVTVENWKNGRRWVWPTVVKWEKDRFYAYITDVFASGWESSCFVGNNVTHWTPMPAPAEDGRIYEIDRP